ncbi:helix-turn-helix transcriptional regulator [Spiractinospora alimapuensis]|uniref:helix-turn-helix domain-containing protein n=1 Tax=Spiractinospora alimapuensis TaxID=2820884 RepID=UPI001F4570CA|nr:helix-turn-helix transcriptional regulator [Spiractinospora alimapuensis]QVQ51133.1 helix-turn-helix transcriptional regulator [Spiractinospora alimapuensis]
MNDRHYPPWERFGEELRKLRTVAGMTQTRLAQQINLSQSMVGFIERGERPPQRQHVEALEEVFATDGSLLRKWSHIKERENLPDWYRQVVASEERAREIRMWHPTLVPGLLQTPEYASVVFQAGRPLDTDDEIAKDVAARVARFDQLTKRGGPRLWAAVDETVIRRSVGDRKVTRSQLLRLIELARAGTVRIQVVPTETPHHPGLAGPFRLVTFDDREAMVYVEHAAGGELISDGVEVRRLSALFGELQAWALTPRESIGLIEEVASAIPVAQE